MMHARGPDRLELGQPFGRRLPGPLVLADHLALVRMLTPRPFFAHARRLEGHDLPGEPILGHRHRCLLLRGQSEPIDVLAGDPVLLCDPLRRCELIGHVVGQVRGDRAPDAGTDVGTQGDPAHRLHAAGDAHVDRIGGDQVVDEVVGLLGGAALAVDRRRRLP